MTWNGVCHTLWEVDDTLHVCGRVDEHVGWHQCACGEVLHTGRTALTPEQQRWRGPACPVCLAGPGRPCHTTAGAVMSGVHADRKARAERRG